MQWVEFIHMRSHPTGLELNLATLTGQIGDCRAEHLASKTVLKHSIYPGDLAVVLTWENDRHPVKTREGLALAEFMSRHGSVEHGVWEVVTTDR